MLAAALTPVVLSACSGSSAIASPAAQPGTPSPTATASPADQLAQARRLVQDGECEAAIDPYMSALTASGEPGVAARFELARLYDRLDREQDAAAQLDELLKGPATSESVMRGWYLAGSVRQQLGDRDGAVAAYQRYIDLGGAATAFARIEQARVVQDTDRDRALAALDPLVNGGGPAAARIQALRLAGSLEDGAGRQDRALARYTALNSLASSATDHAFALDRIAAMQQALGNTDAAVAAWLELVRAYPTTSQAEAALDSLNSAGRPADPLAAGIVQYRRNNNQPARDLLNQALRDSAGQGTNAASALFFLGALAERRDDADLALENYDESYQAAPTGPLAVEALGERANVLASSGRTDDARAAYARVADTFPTSTRAAGARFESGYLAYGAGKAQDARAAWSAGMNAPAGADAARAAFWNGRAASEQGDAAGARLAWTEATRRDPTGYYGLRAAAVLAGEPRAPSGAAGKVQAAPPDWTAAERWLASWAGPEDPRPWQTIAASEDWRAGMELLQIGRFSTGTDLLAQVIAGRRDQPWALYRMARSLADANQPHLAESAAAGVLSGAPVGGPVDGSIARLAYPAPWTDQVTYYAGQYGLDPLLMYAIIRQESGFNPVAGSSAGAFSLTQIVAGTAGDIARALGKDTFSFPDLARPVVAIQFGSYYIGAQLRSFNGNIYQALAAYNAGGGNIARWAAAGGDADVDRFYEEIDYSETRLYLRLVLQNYAWYRYLYGGASKPSLTAGGV
jgi:soluble lytic murein transglycosylase